MSSLHSDLFRGDSALQAALTLDAAHVLTGAHGQHVRKIQAALTLLLYDPPSAIAEAEKSAGRYGDTTARAVLRFKIENNIINPNYQTTPDDITGKMTMRALDDAMAGVEAELAADMLGILARLDQLLVSEGLVLSLGLAARINHLKALAASLIASGGPRMSGGRFARDRRAGLHFMDEMDDVVSDYRPQIVFAALPLVAAGGAAAALAAFLLAIAALIALILLVQLMIDSGKLGSRVSQAIEEVLEAGEQAIVESVVEVERLSAAVDICKQRSQNGNPACLAALAKFALKRIEVVTKRGELQSILKDLRDSLAGSPKKLVWKILAKRAKAAGEALAKSQGELVEIVREIIKECGCIFIKI